MIASIAAHRASLGQFTSDYCSSKGAVLSLTRQLGSELAPMALRANCISPGYAGTVDQVDRDETLANVKI